MRKLLVFILILISIKGLAQYDSIKISTPNSGVGDNLRTAGGKMNAVITHLNTIQIYNISQPEMAILNGALASTAEINHLVGVTSPVQTQLNARAPLASPTFTGTVVLPATTSIGTVSNTEILALDGVTGSLNYSSENYGATGTGDIVLNTGPTLTTVNITDVIKLTPTASPPSGATEGMIYADTDHHLYYYNGTSWVSMTD